MPRIAWIEDAAACGELAGLYEEVKRISPTGKVDDVIRCQSLRPDFLAPIVQAARLHFTDGALTQAQHEMIASYVSALNHCDHCLSGHPVPAVARRAAPPNRPRAARRRS
jgi:AhpD family alkylhydroperoxidase